MADCRAVSTRRDAVLLTRLRAGHTPLFNVYANQLDTAKLKSMALEHLRLDLRNCFEGLQPDEDASPEDE